MTLVFNSLVEAQKAADWFTNCYFNEVSEYDDLTVGSGTSRVESVGNKKVLWGKNGKTGKADKTKSPTTAWDTPIDDGQGGFLLSDPADFGRNWYLTMPK